MTPPRARLLRILLVVCISLMLLYVGGCVRVSNGVWHIRSAALPEAWPELTPVGSVEVKSYPTYRAAVVRGVDVRGGMEPMFMTLFDHISRRDIAMTAPVEMTYGDASSSSMTSMAFLYRTTDLGATGRRRRRHGGRVRAATVREPRRARGLHRCALRRRMGIVAGVVAHTA